MDIFMRHTTENQLFPLSKSQMEILRLETETIQDMSINVQAIAVYLEEDYTDAVVEQAVNLILQQEQALRLQIVYENGGYFQWERPYCFTPVPSFTCHSLDEDDFTRFLCEKAAIPIRCTDYPLRHFFLCRGKEKSALVVVGHHIIFDSWSFLLFAHMFSELCRRFAFSRQPQIPFHRFTDACLTEQEQLRSPRYERALRYWSDLYASPPPLCQLQPGKAPSDLPEGRRIELALPKALAKELTDFCTKQEISPSTAFQTALTLWLFLKNPNAARIDFGQMTLGRTSLPEKQTLGNFAVEHMICVPVHKAMTVSKLIKTIQQVTLEAFYHGLLLHDDILALAQRADPARTAIRDLEFGYVPFPQASLSEPEVDWLTEEEPETSAEYLVYHSKSHGIRLFFHYRTAVFTSQEAQETFDGILSMLNCCLFRTEESLGELFVEKESQP